MEGGESRQDRHAGIFFAMERMLITVVGQDLFKIVEEKFSELGINKVNRVNTSMLGNLKSLTFGIDIPEAEVIKTRSKLMAAMAEDNKRLMPMYVYGDWMRIFVLRAM